MRIGIDMIGVQSPRSGGRMAGRFARQLVDALLGRDEENRHVLYLHEGMATDRVPTRRGVPRVVLAPVASARGPARRRLATQRLIDRNPDGLDWLILLDPFEPSYDGPPPEAPIGCLRIASVVVELAAPAVDHADLMILARHDLILAMTEPVAAIGRRRLGPARGKIRAIEPATDPRPAPGPMTTVAAQELGDLGLRGPFLLADVTSGVDRPGLLAILDAYADLPIATRSSHQLALIGHLDDPDSVRARLHDRGGESGLVLIDAPAEATVGTLLGRCSAYLAPASDGMTPGMVEAIGRGAAIVAVGPRSDDDLADLLTSDDLAQEVRSLSIALAPEFSWDATIDTILAALGEVPDTEMGRHRFDQSHAVRPRIALFPHVPTGRLNPADLVPAGLDDPANIDLYCDAADLVRIAGLPVEYGGFDARLFARNDAVLDYHAVVHDVADEADALRRRTAIASRPGLVRLVGEGWSDLANDRLLATIESLTRSGSRLLFPCPWLAARVRLFLPHLAGRMTTILPPDDSDQGDDARSIARDELGVPDDVVVVARILDGPAGGTGLAVLHAFKDLARAMPGAMLVLDDADDDVADLRAVAGRLKIDDRVVSIPLDGRAAGFDVAIYKGDESSARYRELLRADVATIVHGLASPVVGDAVRRVALGSSQPGLVEAVRELATDPEARAELARSVRSSLVGDDDGRPAAEVWAEEIARCGSDVPRAEGRRRGRPEAIGDFTKSPHFPRAASATTAAAPRSR